MWFVLLAIALVIVAAGGWYFRRRVLDALVVVGTTRRTRRVVGWVIPWLLFGVPILTIAFVATSLALGRETIAMPSSGLADWLLVYPFWLAVLVMLQSVPWMIAAEASPIFLKRRCSPEALRRGKTLFGLIVIAAFSVYTPVRILIERGTLDIHHFEVGTGDSRLRVAFMADLQQDDHTDAERASDAINAMNRSEPDIILVGGDWITSGVDHVASAARSGGRLSARLGVFSVRGDHEHFAYRDQQRSVREISVALAGEGIEVIHNQVRRLRHDGKDVAIVYLSYNYLYRTPDPEILRLLDAADGADFKILLTHQFDEHLASLIGGRVDLALAGHTHGGQVNPVLGLAHVSVARVEGPYVTGRYEIGTTTLIVTSGIGFSIAPFRYASPASVEIVDIRW